MEAQQDQIRTGPTFRANAILSQLLAVNPTGGPLTGGGDIEKVLNQFRPQIDAAVEKWLPRTMDQKALDFLCGKARYAYDAESVTKGVIAPIWNIMDRGGKRWRPALLLMVAEALGSTHSTVSDFIAICELVHNGSLILDDIEDGSQLRRGLPCLHRVYTLDIAVNAGCAMYFLPLVVLREMRGKIPDKTLVTAYELYSQEMINLHIGQGLDIYWHNGFKDPSVQEYLQMCAYKTGTLARLSAKLSALIVGGTDAQINAIGRFAESIGVAFQIQDDILNIAGEKFKGHEFGEDIHEGKKTLMVIHALQKSKDAKRLTEILNLHTTDEKLIHEAINIMKETKSIEFAQKTARDIITTAWKEIDPTLTPSNAKQNLKAFADYLIEREF